MQLTIESLQKNRFLQCGLATFIGFLIVSWLHIRPLGIIFLMIFGFWLYKTRCSFRLVPPPELTRYYNNLLEEIIAKKQNNPILFASIISVILGCLAIVGHFVSGSAFVVIGLAIGAIISTKYNFKIMKIQPTAADYECVEKCNSFECDDDVDDEFMPDVNESNLFVLQKASDLASITTATNGVEIDNDDDKSDDIPSELLLADNIPEIDGDDSSDDEHNDLLPIIEPIRNTADESCSSTKSQDKSIGFVNFKADISLSDTSSSSSEENLSKGLRFPEVATRDTTQSTDNYHTMSKENIQNFSHTVLTNTNKFLPKFMSGLLHGTLGVQGPSMSPSCNQRVVTALDSSDESDFEILQTEDFK